MRRVSRRSDSDATAMDFKLHHDRPAARFPTPPPVLYTEELERRPRSLDGAVTLRRLARAGACHQRGRESCAGIVSALENLVSAQREGAHPRPDGPAGSGEKHTGRSACTPLS